MKRQDRFDSFGNKLQMSEHQRRDTGKYEFKYQNAFGKRKTITASTLEELRAKERQIRVGKDSENLLKTFYEIWKSNRSMRVSEKTMHNYLLIYKNHIETVLENVDVTVLDPFSIEEFYMDLLRKKKLSTTLIDSIHTVLYGILEIARKKRVIPDNPAAGATDFLREARSREARKRKEKAIPKDIRDNYLRFLWEKYSDFPEVLIIYLMALTGCRFGEVAGLTVDDIDLERKAIDINHTISYGYKELDVTAEKKGSCGFIISDVKTAMSERDVPISNDDVIEAIGKRIRKNKRIKKVAIDGYKGFIFVKETGFPYSDRNVNDFLEKTRKEYNFHESELAKKEGRKAERLLDKITCHMLRHTAATIMSAKGVPMPTIQRALGHVDIQTTQEVYCNPNFDDCKGAVKYLDLDLG